MRNGILTSNQFQSIIYGMRLSSPTATIRVETSTLLSDLTTFNTDYTMHLDLNNLEYALTLYRVHSSPIMFKISVDGVTKLVGQVVE